MANEEQLRILMKGGVKAWNKWREKNEDVEIDLSRANLSRANLSGVNLSEANLYRAQLKAANLSGANLSRAKLRAAHLHSAKLRAANLSGADLYGTSVSRADLSEANLSEVNFVLARALSTNFQSATLTGSCIEEWNIRSETNFDNVICDYIYLKYDKNSRNPTERRPSDPNRNFEPGEFAKLVEKSIETVDLIFKDGIDWGAFLGSYQDIQVQYGEQNVSIQAIEKKSDGAFVIRLNVPPEANKADIESKAKQSYETKLQVLEAQYHVQLQAKDDQIAIYRQHNASLENIVNTLAIRPINVIGSQAVASSESQRDTYNQSGNFGIGHMSGGTIGKGAEVGGVINKVEANKLTEVATKIEQLLDYFEQNDPSITQAQQIVKTATEEQPEILDAEIVKEAINSSPTLKQRLGAASVAAYIETVKMLLPPFGIAYEAYKAYRNPEIG